MNKKDCYTSLGKILKLSIRDTLSLNDLLTEEKKLLPSESDLLVNNSDEKSAMIKQLNHYHNEISALVTSCGYEPSNDGIESCITWCDQNNILRKKWHDFIDQVRYCQSMNQVNGCIVDNGLRAVKQALSLLYGQTNSQQTYNAYGQEDQNGLGRTIAKV